MSVAGGISVVNAYDGMVASLDVSRPGLARADRRMVTALFCDIVESSKLVIPQDPEDAYDQLSGLIDIMRRHVQGFGGTLCQTLGDGIYAVFGAPVSQENHAIRACYAADAILREVARGDRAVRIGLSSGEVLWDHAVEGRQSSSPATGAAIHIAAKMQQSALPNSARIADSTARLVCDWVETRPSMLLALGGNEPTQSHELLGLRSRRRQSADDLPMVGRELISKQLLAALSRLDGDVPSAFSAHLVQGAAGMGKTRLMRTLADMARSRGLRVIEWQVPAVEPVGAPGPLQQLVVELLDGPLPRTGSGIAALLRAAGAGPDEADALAYILRPPVGGKDTGAQAILVQAVDALAALVRSVAARRPLLLLVEDAHWADSAVQAVLSALLNLPEATRLTLVLSSREEGLAPAVAGQPGLHLHPLGPLGGHEVGRLLDLWMGQAASLDTIKADLTRRARGNPFFLVEFIRVLMMNGTLLGDVGAMLPGEAPKFPLPDTVQTLMAARTDLLDEDARNLLRAASVVGSTFDAALLSALVGDVEMRRHLPELVRAGLIDETRLLPRKEYSFHHALLHEAVYTGVTRHSRKQLHGQLAELLDQSELAELPGRVAAQARHAAAGEQWPLAVRAGRNAGLEALARSLAPEAVSLLSIAIDANGRLVADHQVAMEAIDLRVALARAAMPAGQGERAMAELGQAVRLAEQAGDKARALAGLVHQINYERMFGHIDRAVELAESALRYSGGREMAHPELLMVAAQSYIDRGDPETALALLDQSRRAGPGHESGLYLMLDPEMVWSISKANCLSLLGRDGEVDGLIQQALRLADNPDIHPFSRIYARAYASEIRMRQRRFGEVLAYSSEGLSFARSTGAGLLDTINMARRGLALAYLGRVSGGLADIEQSLRLANNRGAMLHSAWARHAKCIALALSGRFDEAIAERAILARVADDRQYGLLQRFIPTEASLSSLSGQLSAPSSFAGTTTVH